ncbi:BA14K family protein [Kaistia nematophila]|uniref:Lectin-like protein BA14k n=1 Tax=Kaistia nematophila TaxID=2994654 RepID=A0A9X3IL03_9HYPH|nr:BA14K family protein [Kaistia nematophila]MCX5569342.1 BA14K family protein [Kaistia nematophila]
MLKRTKAMLRSGLAIAVFAASIVALGTPAQAAGPAGDGSFQVADNWNGNRWHGGGNDWRWRHGNRWHGGGWHGGYYYGDNWGGAAAAAGIMGLATGAIIANSANQPRYYEGGYGGDYVAYCASRYRTFDPRTGTYVGFDGYRHRCMMP